MTTMWEQVAAQRHVLVRSALNERGQHYTYVSTLLLVKALDMQWIVGIGERGFRAGMCVLEQEKSLACVNNLTKVSQ